MGTPPKTRNPCQCAYFADLGRRFHAIVGMRFTPLRAAVSRYRASLANGRIESVLTDSVKSFHEAIPLPNAFTGKRKAVGVVDEPVEDGVSQGGVTHGLVPVLDG